MQRGTVLLWTAAAVALAAGGWPWVSRWAEQREVQQHQAALQREVQQQADAARTALAQRKPQIVAELQRLQAAGEHAQVIAQAAQYRLADDADVRALATQSAQAMSLAQTLERLSALATQHCQADAVRQHLQTAFAAADPKQPTPDGAGWTIERLSTADFMQPMQARVRAWGAEAASAEEDEHEGEHAHQHPPAATALEFLRGDHPPRLAPALAFVLMQGQPVDAQVCVWRVRGQAALGAYTQGRAKPFDVTLWMAPAATERHMDFDILSAQGF